MYISTMMSPIECCDYFNVISHTLDMLECELFHSSSHAEYVEPTDLMVKIISRQMYKCTHTRMRECTYVVQFITLCYIVWR